MSERMTSAGYAARANSSHVRAVARRAELEAEWLTSEEAAAMLGVHRSTLSRSAIPYRQDRASSWRRYRRADLELYVSTHTIRPTRHAKALGDPR